MNIHEYQAKALLKEYGAPVAAGHVARSAHEAAAHARDLGGETFVVKAQIHAGGRGKGGGIKLVKTLDELKSEADRMLGKRLVTPQTGPKGRIVRRVYVVKDATIARELYLSLLVDRGIGRVAFIASTEGGMDIERVAAETPEKIATLTVDPASGLSGFHGRMIAAALKLEGPLAKQCFALVASLYKLFVDKDASLIEINPLVVTKAGNLLASTPRSVSTTTRCSAITTSPSSATSTRKSRPRSRRAARALLRQARRQHRLPGERRRPGHGHDGHHQAARRRARQLPRRRRRRDQGTGDRGLPDHPVRHEREGHSGQHLRRHHALRHDRRRHHRRGARGRLQCRWWCGSKAPMSSKARSCSRERLAIIPADDLTTRPRRSSQPSTAAA